MEGTSRVVTTSNTVTVVTNPWDAGIVPNSYPDQGPNRHERRKAAALARKQPVRICPECNQPESDHAADCMAVN